MDSSTNCISSHGIHLVVIRLQSESDVAETKPSRPARKSAGSGLSHVLSLWIFEASSALFFNTFTDLKYSVEVGDESHQKMCNCHITKTMFQCLQASPEAQTPRFPVVNKEAELNGLSETLPWPLWGCQGVWIKISSPSLLSAEKSSSWDRALLRNGLPFPLAYSCPPVSCWLLERIPNIFPPVQVPTAPAAIRPVVFRVTLSSSSNGENSGKKKVMLYYYHQRQYAERGSCFPFVC